MLSPSQNGHIIDWLFQKFNKYVVCVDVPVWVCEGLLFVFFLLPYEHQRKKRMQTNEFLYGSLSVCGILG